MSQFCRDYEITGEDRARFMTFINAMDGEYLTMVAEEAKKKEKER